MMATSDSGAGSDAVAPSVQRYGLSTANRKIDALLVDGPQPMAALPGSYTIRPEVRQLTGVRRLVVNLSNRGSCGSPQKVWYLPDVHPPELVVRRYLSTNPQLLEQSTRAITRGFGRHDDALAEVWRAIREEYGHGPSQEGGV